MNSKLKQKILESKNVYFNLLGFCLQLVSDEITEPIEIVTVNFTNVFITHLRTIWKTIEHRPPGALKIVNRQEQY